MPRAPKESGSTADERLVLRPKPGEKVLFEQAAAAEHMNFSTWARRAMHRQAEVEARERARREQAP